MSEISMGKRIMVGKPPDKGSFPLDHFNECSSLKAEYLRCLREHNFDNMSCRYLSKQYLECRMERNLMSQEPLKSLGYLEEEEAAKPARKRKGEKSKEDKGWLVGIDGVKPDRRDNWRAPTLFSLFRPGDKPPTPPA
mmetsp:Transcript_130139/g.278080  ORF Transcript_130139/g.278080 Transcript_130139/m.278080 type:complete len:137 (-) Transcript_130139:92-502(-)